MESENKSYILNEDIQHNIKLIAETQAEKLSHGVRPDPLVPQEQRIKLQEIELEKELTLFFEKFVAGLHEIIATLMSLGGEDAELYSEEIQNQLGRLMEGLSTMNVAPEDTRSPKEICGLTAATMKAFNRAVIYLYDEKYFEKASTAYFFLTFLDPQEPAYWLGYGNSEFFLKRYQSAIDAYKYAGIVDPTDPHSHFYSVHCYHELNQIKNAIESCEKAVEAIKRKPEYAEDHSSQKELLHQAQQLKLFFEEVSKK